MNTRISQIAPFWLATVVHHDYKPHGTWHIMIVCSYLCVCGLRGERHSQERSRVSLTACHVSLEPAVWPPADPLCLCLLGFARTLAHLCLPKKINSSWKMQINSLFTAMRTAQSKFCHFPYIIHWIWKSGPNPYALIRILHPHCSGLHPYSVRKF